MGGEMSVGGIVRGEDIKNMTAYAHDITQIWYKIVHSDDIHHIKSPL